MDRDNAIAAVSQGCADWGLAIESVAHAGSTELAEVNDLGFLPYKEDRYDFVIPKSRREYW